MLDKFAVARALREIGMLLEVKGENPFKVRAYETGARALEEALEELPALVASGRLTELRGVGEALAKKVSELHRTGRTDLLDRLRQELPAGVLELLRVPDLGPKKIAALRSALGIGSLAELEAACRSGRVRGVKGFGEKTEQRILENLARLASRPRGMLLSTALEVCDGLVSHLRGRLPPGVRVDVAGSVRRMKETVSDIDLVASSSRPAEVGGALVSFPSMAEVLGQGGRRLHGPYGLRAAPQPFQDPGLQAVPVRARRHRQALVDLGQRLLELAEPEQVGGVLLVTPRHSAVGVLPDQGGIVLHGELGLRDLSQGEAYQGGHPLAVLDAPVWLMAGHSPVAVDDHGGGVQLDAQLAVQAIPDVEEEGHLDAGGRGQGAGLVRRRVTGEDGHPVRAGLACLVGGEDLQRLQAVRVGGLDEEEDVDRGAGGEQVCLPTGEGGEEEILDPVAGVHGLGGGRSGEQGGQREGGESGQGGLTVPAGASPRMRP